MIPKPTIKNIKCYSDIIYYLHKIIKRIFKIKFTLQFFPNPRVLRKFNSFNLSKRRFLYRCARILDCPARIVIIGMTGRRGYPCFYVTC